MPNYSHAGIYHGGDESMPPVREQMKSSRFARVIVDQAIRRELDYSIPEVLAGRVSIGSRVRVPFRDRRGLATVVALIDETDASGIRQIEAVIGESPTLSPTL